MKKLRGIMLGALVLFIAFVMLMIDASDLLPAYFHDNKQNVTAITKEKTNMAPGGCYRLYQATPWNQKISEDAPIHPDSALLIGAFEGALGSNPYSWTIPVYEVDRNTSLVAIRITNRFRNVIVNDSETIIEYTEPGSAIYVPIPKRARPSLEQDAQFVVLNVDTGDEWGFYQASTDDRGWVASGAYHYNVRWSGVPPEGFAGRGGGSPYLAGLVRWCEVEQGVIPHALVMGYDSPCTQATCEKQGYPHFVYPAIKSDGRGTYAYDLPEGARLQLDPQASEAELSEWCGHDQTCRVMVRAMQDYGVFIMENSGHPKIFVEDDITANWGTFLDKNTVANIPYTAFQVLDWNN